MCRKHTLLKSKDHPLQKIDTIYARPLLAEEEGPKSYTLWTWARQDTERNFSIASKYTVRMPEVVPKCALRKATASVEENT